MNIFLIPYTWMRHLSMAFWCAGAGLLAWWVALTWLVTVGPVWPIELDGPLLMCAIASTVAGASILGEANLRRQPIYARVLRVLLAAMLTGIFTFIWYYLWDFLGQRILFGDDPDASDPSLVSLKFRLGAFAMGGISTGLGPLIVRKGSGFFTHLAAGLATGFVAAVVWQISYYTAYDDLYKAGAYLGLAWGFAFGLMAWGIPDDLYAGWVRVLTPTRFSRRIPIDAVDRTPKERFIGHFPRGLDLFLPVEDGVLELHVSIAVNRKQQYSVRGLTLAPTKVKRFLERIDLRYDPRRPAPLETSLSPGDRILMGQGAEFSEIEFLMLPREEK